MICYVEFVVLWEVVVGFGMLYLSDCMLVVMLEFCLMCFGVVFEV